MPAQKQKRQFAHYVTDRYIASLEESYLLKIRSLCRSNKNSCAIAVELSKLSDNFVTAMNFAARLKHIKERYYA